MNLIAMIMGYAVIGGILLIASFLAIAWSANRNRRRERGID